MNGLVCCTLHYIGGYCIKLVTLWLFLTLVSAPLSATSIIWNRDVVLWCVHNTNSSQTGILSCALELVKLLPNVHVQGRSRSRDFGSWHITNRRNIAFGDGTLTMPTSEVCATCRHYHSSCGRSSSIWIHSIDIDALIRGLVDWLDRWTTFYHAIVHCACNVCSCAYYPWTWVVGYGTVGGKLSAKILKVL